LRVLFLVSDALRASELNCLGYERNTTPFINKLGEKGLVYEQCFSTSNHTDPSFTSFMTGLFPFESGIVHHGFDVTVEEEQQFNSENLALSLSDKGFCCVGVDWLGRWHKQGFSEYGLPRKASWKKQFKRFVPQCFRRQARSLGGRMGFTDQPDAKRLTLHAIEKIEEHVDEDLFMLVHYWDTHTPFDQLPRKYKRLFGGNGFSGERTQRVLRRMSDGDWKNATRDYHLRGVRDTGELIDFYDGATRFFDDEVKRLTLFLQDEGLLHDTIIVVLGDHGDSLVRNGVFQGHNGLNEEVTHVPLIVFGEHLGRKRVEQFVQLNGLKKAVEGLVQQGRFEMETMDKVFTVDAKSDKCFSMRSKDFNLVWSEEEKLLYDLKEDSSERRCSVLRDDDDLVVEAEEWFNGLSKPSGRGESYGGKEEVMERLRNLGYM